MADRIVSKFLAYSAPLIGSLNANVEARSSGDGVRVSTHTENAATFTHENAAVASGQGLKASSSNECDFIQITCRPIIQEWTDELETEFDDLAVDFAVGKLDEPSMRWFRQLESTRNRFISSGSESFMLHEQIKSKRVRELKEAIRKYFRPIAISAATGYKI